MRAPTVPVQSVARHADELLDLLVDVGPLTGIQCCEKLGWPRGRFDSALKFAREQRCPSLGMAIPNPTPADGWRYQVTTEWEPVEAGASYSLGIVESRLAGIHRDVRIVLPHLVKGSREHRRANFLNKHLDHILRTLTEIDHG
jgi:hypothetical protein